ncbi:MAG: GHMP kinase [Candidatus Aminicenantes bacterium]|nr:GHMP kinase [Candidatus Aminicenantes bacterium]
MARGLRTIHARAPLRVNDIGGWTDTWFARRGRVLNLAVGPPVEVQVAAVRRLRAGATVLVHAENYGQSFRVDPARPSSGFHPLLQTAVRTLPPPAGWSVEVRLHSPVPAGISTGTSAAVCVALLGALDALRGGRLGPAALAALAHRVETEKLGRQSGIQDQISAAYGGICDIDIEDYPRARVERIKPGADVVRELERRLCLVYLGRPHRSSAIHESVIARLEAAGGRSRALERLAAFAGRARRALLAGDLDAYGAVMAENNEAQRALHPRLVSERADRVIAIARKHGAAGWKVNGAGGAGGSLTILSSADDGLRRRMIEGISGLGGGVRRLPLVLSPSGFAAWEI